jgi:hypothetical protein
VQLSPIVPVNNVAPGSTEFPVPPIAARTVAWGFEDATVDGFTGTGGAVSVSTAWAHTGTDSLLVTADGTNPGGQWGAQSAGQPCSAGQLVSVSAAVKNPNGSGSLTAVKTSVTWLGPGSSALSTTSGGTVSLAAGATGTVTLVNAQAPQGAVSFTVNVVNAASSSAGVLLGADDITYTLAPPAQFDGTYTMLVVFGSFSSPSSSRTVTVTINQYEAVGGTNHPATTDPVSFTPSTDITNGFVVAGNLTLPGLALARDNATCVYTAQITDSNTSDTVLDLLIIDNNGQTVLVNDPGSGYTEYFFDEPDPKFDLGLHLGSQNGRPQAVSVTGSVDVISGGPLTLEPGDNKLLAYSLSGPPYLGLEFFSRWYQERLE